MRLETAHTRPLLANLVTNSLVYISAEPSIFTLGSSCDQNK